MTSKNDFVVSDELQKEIQSPSVEEKPMITKLLQTIFNPTVSDSEKLLPAEDAYLRSTFHVYITKKEIFHKLVRKIKDAIKFQMEKNDLYAFIEIHPEGMDYAPEIANALREYGYKVWVLGKDELESIHKDIENKVNRTTMFMLVIWDKVYE